VAWRVVADAVGVRWGWVLTSVEWRGVEATPTAPG